MAQCTDDNNNNNIYKMCFYNLTHILEYFQCLHDVTSGAGQIY